MDQLILDVPEDSLLSLKLSDEAASAEIRIAASMKLYELGRLSSGAAARLAWIPRTLFLSKLSHYGIDTSVSPTTSWSVRRPLPQVICTTSPL